MTTRPVQVSVSQATRLYGSWAKQASRIASDIWSAILSGCPSVTDSLVNRKRSRLAKTTPFDSWIDSLHSNRLILLPFPPNRIAGCGERRDLEVGRTVGGPGRERGRFGLGMHLLGGLQGGTPQSGMDHELPDAPAKHGQHGEHGHDSQPFTPGSRRLARDAPVADVFGKADPVDLLRAGQSAGAVAGFKTLEPGGLIESERAEIAANEALAEDASGKLRVVLRLEIE